jgi:hypothetical protein
MNQAVGSKTAANRASSTWADNQTAVNPPRIAPAEVAISSVMPSFILAVPRSTFVLATALEVAITETMLVVIA